MKCSLSSMDLRPLVKSRLLYCYTEITQISEKIRLHRLRICIFICVINLVIGVISVYVHYILFFFFTPLEEFPTG